MVRIKSTVKINQAATSFIDSLPDRLLNEIYPKVVARVERPIKASIKAKLPDGQASGTRAKQSKKTQLKFPHAKQMRKNVGRKTIHDSLGTLILIGVTREASHVNFDHGEKAKTVGRVHKLWWVDGINEQYANPPLRKQIVDIPLQVRTEFEGTISQTFIEEIKRLRA